MAATAQEIERKYESVPAVTLPGLSGVQGVAQETDLPSEDLSAEYYDTDDLRLIRAGVTLRRRRGGHDAGWHLKLPAGADTRQEIRLPLGRAGRRVPAELARLVRGWTRGAALGPVAQIGTIRQRRALLDGSGASLAEVAIDEVSAQSMGETTTLSAWREIEVELTGGDPDLLKAIDKRLRGAGLSPAGHSAKLARALAGRLPETPAPAPLAPGSAARQVVLAYAADQVARMQATHPRVRRDERESVHDMRVATRRLRSTLKTFAAVLAGPDAGPDPGPDPGALRAELKWLADVLGRVRDAEVMAARLDRALGELPPEQVVGPVADRLTGGLRSQAVKDHRTLVSALNGRRYAALLDELDALLAAAPTEQGLRPAKKYVPRRVRRTVGKVEKLLDTADHAGSGGPPRPGVVDRDTALHEARKAAKQARYAAEAAVPVGGSGATELAAAMEQLQELLGDHHDSVVTRQLLRTAGMQAHGAGENGFTYGMLSAAETAAAQDIEARLPAARKELRRKKVVGWLTR